MSQKVTALEQEIERLTDGAELENVSPLLKHTSYFKLPFLKLCLSQSNASLSLCSWEEKSSTWSPSWRERSGRVPPMWPRSERWAESGLLHSMFLVILSLVTAFILLWQKDELCCVFLCSRFFLYRTVLWHPYPSLFFIRGLWNS